MTSHAFRSCTQVVHDAVSGSFTVTTDAAAASTPPRHSQQLQQHSAPRPMQPPATLSATSSAYASPLPPMSPVAAALRAQRRSLLRAFALVQVRGAH